jgi:NifU-like protein
MWECTEKTLEHFLHPRNVEEVENPDGTALWAISPAATLSALTEMIKGMTVEEAEKLTNQANFSSKAMSFKCGPLVSSTGPSQIH